MLAENREYSHLNVGTSVSFRIVVLSGKGRCKKKEKAVRWIESVIHINLRPELVAGLVLGFQVRWEEDEGKNHHEGTKKARGRDTTKTRRHYEER